jgi:nucleoside-diphosphate-sugar epimerase
MYLDGDSSILITGASGFVGQSILDYMSNSEAIYGKRITLIANRSLPILTTKLKEKYKIQFIQKDLMKEWGSFGDFTHFINLAGDGTEDPYSIQSGEKFLRISRNAVKWINNQDLNVFHASSGATLGYVPIDTKATNVWNKENFIRYRLEAEDSFLSEAIPHANVRIGKLFSFMGPRIVSKKQYAINQFIDGAITTGVVNLKGDSRTIRSYLWCDNMAEWILKSFLSPSDSILNIGSSVGVSMVELGKYIASKTGASLEISTDFETGDIYVAPNEDTLKLLGVSEGLSWMEQVDELMQKRTAEAKHGY